VLERVLAGNLSFDFYLEAVSAAVPGTSGNVFSQSMVKRGSTLPVNLLQVGRLTLTLTLTLTSALTLTLSLTLTLTLTLTPTLTQP
jgi:hypothetical protein